MHKLLSIYVMKLILRIFDSVQYTLARQCTNKFDIALDLFVYLAQEIGFAATDRPTADFRYFISPNILRIFVTT